MPQESPSSAENDLLAALYEGRAEIGQQELSEEEKEAALETMAAELIASFTGTNRLTIDQALRVERRWRHGSGLIIDTAAA